MPYFENNVFNRDNKALEVATSSTSLIAPPKKCESIAMKRAWIIVSAETDVPTNHTFNPMMAKLISRISFVHVFFELSLSFHRNPVYVVKVLK